MKPTSVKEFYNFLLHKPFNYKMWMMFTIGIYDANYEDNEFKNFNWSILDYACKMNDWNLVEKLLKLGAYIEHEQGPLRFTPLIRVSHEGSKEVAEVLIKFGANVNVRNVFGWTPLMYTTDLSHIEITKLLLDSGADINAKNTDGKTALDMTKHDDRIMDRVTYDLLIKAGAV